MKLPKCEPCTNCKELLCEIEWRYETKEEQELRKRLQQYPCVVLLHVGASRARGQKR